MDTKIWPNKAKKKRIWRKLKVYFNKITGLTATEANNGNFAINAFFTTTSRAHSTKLSGVIQYKLGANKTCLSQFIHSQFPKLQVVSLNAKRRDAMISANIGHFSMTFENAGFIFVFSIYIRAATKLKSFIIQEG